VRFLELATPMAERSVPTIRLRPRTKIAMDSDWPALATTDVAVLEQWNAKTPDANCGAVAQARIGGVWFLEQDTPPPGVKSVTERIEEETGQKIPLTFRVRSRKGENGAAGRGHYYWKQTAESIAVGNVTQDYVKHGDFSVRVNNEYVVAAGSIHPLSGEPYEMVCSQPIIECPLWLIEWIKKQRTTQKLDAALEGEPIPHGQHDWTLFRIACKLRDIGLEEEGIYNHIVEVCEKRCVDYGLDYLDMCRNKAIQACKYPVGSASATVFMGAKPLDGVPLVGTPQPAAANALGVRTFKYPRIKGSHRDYVIAPAMGQRDGWFPQDSPSLIAASSGGGKTSLMMDILEKQLRKESCWGHGTFGLRYQAFMIDRGEEPSLRTLERLGLDPQLMKDHMRYLPIAVDEAALAMIQSELETFTLDEMPQVLFIEGGEMLVTNPCDGKYVVPFMRGLQQIAKHYHVAIILSVGAPKTKIGEGYVAKRDSVFGSEKWSRMAETVVAMYYVDGDDTGKGRTVFVLLRNGPPEKFDLMFEPTGRLVANQHVEQSRREPEEITWFKVQALMAKEDAGKKWWTIQDMERGMGMSYATAQRRVRDALTKLHIVKKPGPKVGRGAADQYGWNESESNPLWVIERSAIGGDNDLDLDAPGGRAVKRETLPNAPNDGKPPNASDAGIA
jgi:hypothetical protein